MSASSEEIAARKRKREDVESTSPNVKLLRGTGHRKSESQQIQVQGPAVSSPASELMIAKRMSDDSMERYRVREIEGGDVFYIEKVCCSPPSAKLFADSRRSSSMSVLRKYGSRNLRSSMHVSVVLGAS